MSDAVKIKGKVKWFDLRKGYGYITDENGVDHFVHRRDIESGRSYLGFEENDEVEFESTETAKGLQANAVVLTKEAPPRKRERVEKKLKKDDDGDNANSTPPCACSRG